MAKKRATRRAGGTDRGLDAAAAKDPVTAAAAAVEKARATLECAQHAYDEARAKAVEQKDKARALTIGDILDGTLAFVRRHPAVGILTAGLIGFLLGRTKKR